MLKMVKLTAEFVLKNCKSKLTCITHLYLNARKIDEIGEINASDLKDVAVIYLHMNLIENVGNLSTLKNVTHLYLQWNRITSISNLNGLPNLTNLYLGFNSIKILDGLKGMVNLQVLNIEGQNLTSNDQLTFDEQTLNNLNSLLELNVSKNNITSLWSLRNLRTLSRIDISNNMIGNLDDLCNTLKYWNDLKEIELRGNSVFKNKKCEAELIATCLSLETINDKRVSPTNRVFLRMLKTIRYEREKRKLKEKHTEFSSETKAYAHQLPLEFREIVFKSVLYDRRDQNFTKNENY